MAKEKGIGSPTADYVVTPEASPPISQPDTALDGLTQEHRDYLMIRHGTVELDPLPTADPSDPLNWPTWKVSDEFLILQYRQQDSMRHQKNMAAFFPPTGKTGNESLRNGNQII